MSAWRIALQELHHLGGTAPARKFGDDHSRNTLRNMRLADFRQTRDGFVWHLTALGWEVVDGRIVRIIGKCKTPGKGRGPDMWRATWLRSLPRAGEIRL